MILTTWSRSSADRQLLKFCSSSVVKTPSFFRVWITDWVFLAKVLRQNTHTQIDKNKENGFNKKSITNTHRRLLYTCKTITHKTDPGFKAWPPAPSSGQSLEMTTALLSSYERRTVLASEWKKNVFECLFFSGLTEDVSYHNSSYTSWTSRTASASIWFIMSLR